MRSYPGLSMSITIAVLSQKGGTGKTTTTRTLVDVFRRLELSVVAVDADPQGNLSDYFEVPGDAFPTLGEVLAGQARAADAVRNGVVPANLGLAEAELVLAGKIGREVTLRNALRDLKRSHEIVVIDCPPTLGLLTVNALVASTHAVITTEAQYFSLQGVEQAIEVLGIAREALNPDLELLGVVMNIANMRTKHAKGTQQTLRERFGDKLFETVIRQSVAYAESAQKGVPILDHNPEKGQDYLDLADEVLERLGLADARQRLAGLREEIVPEWARRDAPRRDGPAPATGDYSSVTSAPSGVNGTRLTSAQPSAAAASESATLAPDCQ